MASPGSCSGRGVAEGREGVGDAFEGDLDGDHRRDVDVALCDRSQRLVELHRVVAEAELDVQLLADPEERVDRVVAHAHAHHDQAGAVGRVLQPRYDYAGHAYGLDSHHDPAPTRYHPGP